LKIYIDQVLPIYFSIFQEEAIRMICKSQKMLKRTIEKKRSSYQKVKKPSEKPSEKSSEDKNAIVPLLRANDLKGIQKLVEEHPHVLAKQIDYDTPVSYATQICTLEIVKYLIEASKNQGLRMNRMTEYHGVSEGGQTDLDRAIQLLKHDVVLALLSSKADPNFISNMPWTEVVKAPYLIKAALRLRRHRQEFEIASISKIMEYLIEYDANINATYTFPGDTEGFTALDVVISDYYNQLPLAKLLLQKGATVCNMKRAISQEMLDLLAEYGFYKKDD